MLTVDPDIRRSAPPPEPEVVIREARRRQRRRWLLGSMALALLTGSAVTAGVLSQGGRPRPLRHSAPTVQATTTTTPPTAPPSLVSVPQDPASLAVAPDGALYVADDTLNEILERTPDGTFRVVAGDGTAGFSGNGGPATAAEIDDPGGMAVAANGTLYFADVENARIRAVSPTGTITTVAGDGQRAGLVADGTQALDAALLSPTAVTLSPSGQLYIGDGNQVLALQPDGTLTSVTRPGAFVTAGALAFNGAGDLFVYAEDPKSLQMVTPQGTVSTVLLDTFYPRGYAGIVSAPGGTVLAMNEQSVVQVTPGGEQTVVTFPHTYGGPSTYLGVKVFTPAGIAVAPNGTIYVDTNPRGGFASTSAIVAITPTGSSTLLWKAGAS